MPDESGPIQHDRREFLLRKKLGSLLDWQAPAVTKTVGPFDTDAFDRYGSALSDLIGKCCDKLGEYDDETIELMAAKGAEAPVSTEWNRFEQRWIDKLTNLQPPWYAAGFGHPDHAADFQFWSRMPHFTIDEALCLSVGIEPDGFSSERLAKITSRASDKLWPAETFLLRRRDQFTRKFDPFHKNWRVKPKDFIAWAEQVDLECAPEFLRMLRQYHAKGPEPATLVDDSKPADKREIDTMAKLFVLMAIDWLGYVPSAMKSPTPKEIADLAASKGIDISVETIRTYLKRGAKFVDSEPKDG